MRQHTALLPALAALLLAGAALSAAEAALPRYRLDAFTPWPEGWSVQPQSMNGAGLVTGSMSRLGSSREEAFLFQGGQFRPLGVLDGVRSEGVDLNERGEVAGNAFRADGSPVPFLYSGGRMAAIPLPADTGRARALDVNNAGHVLGYTEAGQAFIHDGSRTRFLDAGGLRFGPSTAFNDRGEVFGAYTYRVLDEVRSQPFLWRDGRVTVLPELLDTGPGRFETHLRDATMNNAGQVAFTVSGNNERYDNDSHGYVWNEGRYEPFGQGFFAVAGLSEAGLAVGRGSFLDIDIPNVVIAHRDGESARLDDLLRPGDTPASPLQYAYAVDGRGRVLLSGQDGLLLAAPVPEANALALLVVGMVMVGGVVRRGGGFTSSKAAAGGRAC